MKQNLIKIYEILQQREDKLNTIYKTIKHESSNKTINSMLFTCKLENNSENRLAAATRLISLREDSIVQAMEEDGKSKIFIQEAKHGLYEIVKNYHLDIQKRSLDEMIAQNLLSPFYKTLLLGIHDIGVTLSNLQPFWTKHIIENINELLLAQFKTNKNVIQFLKENALLDEYNGTISDRCYSVLSQKEDGSFEVKTYAQAFPKEIEEVSRKFSKLIQELSLLKDDDFNQEKSYICYFKALKTAFTCKEKTKLIALWMEVDRSWMSVTSPIQVGHPLEYYEDHFRKAVALEWDIRLSNPNRSNKTEIKTHILHMYQTIFNEISPHNKKIYEKCVQNVNRVQLYIGRPAFYYGAEFHGLFSAQVVPNDEIVSMEYGKKIFAFSDNILNSQRAKPFLKIHKEIMGEKFLKELRDVIFHKEELWHKVYEASTIGHEFGHILWLDEDSEKVMNSGGMFKNIEEFKATLGGLVAFFYNEKEELKLPLLRDTVERAIRLIGWMKTSEVEPYYCEGLMHLIGLFESGVLHFKNSLEITITHESYENTKQWYIKTYKELAKHYLDKQDASLFLERYVEKNEDGFFSPKPLHVKYFVNYYWNLHCKIGRVLDESEETNLYF